MKQNAITKSARGEDCAIRLPGYCNGDTQTTVFAHLASVRFGHGMGHKGPDQLGSYACSACHDCIDYRLRTHYTTQELKIAHYEGIFETMLKLIKKGLINV